MLDKPVCADEPCKVEDATADDVLLVAATEDGKLPLLEELADKLGVDVISDVTETTKLVSVVVGGGSQGRLVLLDDEVVLVLEVTRFVPMHCTLSPLPDVSV